MVDIEEVNDGGGEPAATSTIQLGFSEPIRPQDASLISHRSPCWWQDWDGGQLGGRPSWLQPKDLPLNPMQCVNYQCQSTMQFLCQLYVPLDHVPHAFHRSFYIFGCPTCCRTAGPQGIRVLRVQLPEVNRFYPPENNNSLAEHWNKHLPSSYDIQLCQVCGQRAKGKCPLQQVWFCGKQHQKEYKKQSSTSSSSGGKAKVDAARSVDVTKTIDSTVEVEATKDDDHNLTLIKENVTSSETKSVLTEKTTHSIPSYFPSVYAESELVVEEEPSAENDEDRNDDDDDDEETNEEEIEEEEQANRDKAAAKISGRSTLFPSDLKASKEDDPDQHLEQEDLNEMVTGTKDDSTSTKDPVTNAFYKRIQDRKVPEQCLRYSMAWRQKYDSSNGADATASAESGKETLQKNDNEEDHKAQDDGEPLWIRSSHQPGNVPLCLYCQAPRAFEFQLMPQMLSFLHSNRPSKQPTDSNTSKNNNGNNSNKNETAKQALIAAQNIIRNADPSQIPPSFAEAKAKALKALQEDLYQDDNNRVDWGVVAIYTCTKSCDTTLANDKELGAYREEYAWLQPALDI